MAALSFLLMADGAFTPGSAIRVGAAYERADATHRDAATRARALCETSSDRSEQNSRRRVCVLVCDIVRKHSREPKYFVCSKRARLRCRPHVGRDELCGLAQRLERRHQFKNSSRRLRIAPAAAPRPGVGEGGVAAARRQFAN